MSRSFTLNQLTEGIRDRHVGQEASRIQSKWARTGLLRGLNEHNRENMSRLLENQAAQVLREANTLGSGGSGSIDGFTNIAFPIVRRVFGGLVANELVSIQPMSLPSGLLFYLDYTYGSNLHGEKTAEGFEADGSNASIYAQGDSLYGSPNGRSIQAGADAVGGQYDLAGSGYSKVHAAETGANAAANDKFGPRANNDYGSFDAAGNWTQTALDLTLAKNLSLVQYDPQLVREAVEYGTDFSVAFIEIGSEIQIDKTLIKSVGLVEQSAGGAGPVDTTLTTWDGSNDAQGNAWQQGTNIFNLRRLNQIGTWDGSKFTPSTTGKHLLVVLRGLPTNNLATVLPLFKVVYPKTDYVQPQTSAGTGTTLVVPSFESDFTAGDPNPIIPEIDIKIESIAVTAQTRKLRARWSPELAQDLNAYHSMDAEVELTQILSEQIALEIDREILNDLLVEAKGANFFWSRAPGKFVNKRTGALETSTLGPQFTGTVREWYETLVETIIDVANEIHRKTLRGSANFIVVSPEVATIFEASVLYKPSIKIDGQGQTSAPFSIGAEAIGSLTNRFTVYKDPYFPRNKILVGYKGGSYLESGYVYAPYVPLIVTPTIFAPEDFTPRKGVMTRYGKKMVRADFYGTVTCLDLDII